MGDEIDLGTTPCRSVTPEEIDHFNEFGWSKLTGFVDPDVIGKLLEIARYKMGDDADSNVRRGKDGEIIEPQRGLSYFNPESGGGLNHPVMRPLIKKIGKNAQRLMRRRSGVGVRYYRDIFVPKLPSSRQSRHGGNGPTAFHQDFITFAVDRSGGMTFWFPLEAYGPEFGTMSFVNKSHRMGVLGDYTTYGDGDVLDVYPELRKLETTEPMSYEVGDITVHSHLMVHGAAANIADRPRWAYILLVQPADICWNGSPCSNFDSSNMTQWQPFDEERFPIFS